MFSADNVLINFIRAPIVQIDPKSMGVTAQVAQDLGLSDGQVVKATVEVTDNRVGLVLKGFLIDAPTFKIDAPTFKIDAPFFKIDAPNWSAGNLKTGDTVELKVSQSTNGWVLTPKSTSSNTSNPSAPSVSTVSNVPSTSNASTSPLAAASAASAASNIVARAPVNASVNTASNTAANTVVNTQGNPPLTGGSMNTAGNAPANVQDVPESVNAFSAKSLAALENQNLANAGAPSPNVIPNWSTRLNTLIFEPSQLSAVFELLMPGALTSLLSQPQLQNWVQRWNANRLSMASLNPTALKNIVLAQSKSVERQLVGSSNFSPANRESIDSLNSASNQGGASLGIEQDPKSMLRSLTALLDRMQQTPETIKLSHQVKIATHELESSQVQTAQQLIRGELAFHAVIPFWDADPVDLYFKKTKSGKGDDPEHHLSVDIHSKSRLLGEIWLNTSIKQSSQIDLIMWAVKPEVAELAKTNASELGYELGVSGLTLNSFQIFNAPKPNEVQPPRPHAGSVLDARV